MYISSITLKLSDSCDTSEVIDHFDLLLGALRKNGQVLDGVFPIAEIDGGLKVFLRLPAIDSLDHKNNNKYIVEYYDKLQSLGVLVIEYDIIGKEPYDNHHCDCNNRSSYILYTTFLDVESPLVCGNCFKPIPLYQIPKTKNEPEYKDYIDIISWKSNYQSCDQLQMGCTVGERFGTRQLSNVDSELSKMGIEICDEITEQTGIPTYYYLHKGSGISDKKERKRKCPSCGGEWLLESRFHEFFDFKCDKCRLLSNIAWSV